MELSEAELIARLRRDLSAAPPEVLCGIGDDCAVIRKDAASVFLVTTDCLVEGVHFEFDYFSFLELGKKTMAVNLSDIAAMAGEPRYAVVSIAIPERLSVGDIADFYTGMEQAASEFGTAIVGGDTSRSVKHFFVNVTLIGTAQEGRYKLRSGAKVGDGIYVSGHLGSAAVGLRLLERGKSGGVSYVQAHKNPRPRVVLGRILAETPEVHAAIDLSDGLLMDLGRVLDASEVAAELQYEAIPHEGDFDIACRSVRLAPEQTLLTGGEDYQLLFTMDDAAFATFSKACAAKRVSVTRIGRIVAADAGPKIKVFRGGANMDVSSLSGFDHFKS